MALAPTPVRVNRSVQRRPHEWPPSSRHCWLWALGCLVAVLTGQVPATFLIMGTPSGRSRNGARLQQRHLTASGASDADLDGVVLVPMAEDAGLNFDDLMPEPQPDIPDQFEFKAKAATQPGDGPALLGAPATPAAPSKMPGTAPVADGSAAAAPPSPSKRPKRWLSGRGNAKRKKLEENNKLQAWLIENGVWVSDVADWGRAASAVSMAIETREQLENEPSGRGLVAARDIAIYEDIAKVPEKVLISRESAKRRFGSELIYKNMSDYAATALHLIAEKNDGEDSFWAPYINVLPTVEEVGCSALWDKEELEQFLGGSPLVNMSLYIRKRIGEEFQSLKENILDDNPDKFPPEAFTLEAYEWAYSVLFSRAARIDGFADLPEFICLMPYIDLINHNPSSDTYIVGLEEGVELPMGMGDKERFILVRADKYYDQYEQVYISYGKKSNAQLLMLYGFCLERNAGDFIEVPMAHLLDGDPLIEAKKRWLDFRRIEYKGAFPLYRDRFVSEMMQFLRLLVIQPEDIGLPANAPDLVLDKALSQINFKTADTEVSERRAMLILRGICDDLISAYDTTLEEDERLIGDRTMFELLPKKQRMAMRVRYGEKLILQAVVTTLDRVMNNLGSINELNEKRARMQNDMWGRLGFDFDSPAIRATNLEELMQELDI